MRRLKAYFKHSDNRGILIEICREIIWRQLNFFTLKRGSWRGGHYHKRTRELFFIIEGRCRIEIINIKTGRKYQFIAKEKDILLVEPYESHRVTAMEDSKVAAYLTIPHSKNMADIYEP